MHVIGTAGHVDHGKSALVERLTGIDPDRFAEEKRRGLTIDLGFAWLRLPSGLEVGIVDVPGHERFIKNMLAGAGGISICIFVVAANEGWMPQSAEHLSVLEVLGVHHGVVALTKSDTVDRETLDLAIADVEEHIAGSSLASARIVPFSSTTGEGIDELVAALDELVTSAPPSPDLGRPRLWVDRVFTIAGAGTVVTGTLAGGSFEVGQEVELRGPHGAPGRERRARIRTIQSHKKEVSVVGPGNRVALNLAGLDRSGAQRGDAVVFPGQWRSTSLTDAFVRVLPQRLTGHDYELTEKGALLVYVGSAETPVRMKLIGTDAVHPGEDAFAQLYLRDPLPLSRGDRFVLRDVGRIQTFGGGEVLEPGARPVRRSDRNRIQLLGRLRDATPDEAVRALVEAHGYLAMSDALMRAAATDVPDGVVALGDLLVSEGSFADLAGRLRALLAEHHRSRPLETGMPRELARAALEIEPSAFHELVARLDDVVADGATVRLASHRVEFSAEQQAVKEKLIGAIEGGGFAPPLAKELDADQRLVRAMLDSGELIKIGDFYLTARRAAEARARVRAAIEAEGPITVAQIRDLLGTSRKYAVPLCEWLDQTGATLRRGDVRALGPNP
jgi:selenocysteine-specific elongation factor